MQSNDNSSAVAIVPLNDSLIINDDMFGYVTPRIQVSSLVEMTICFPVLNENSSDCFHSLVCPYEKIVFQNKNLCWGGVYHIDDNNKIIDYQVSALLLKIYGEVDSAGMAIKPEVNRLLLNFLKILEFKNPEAIICNFSNIKSSSDLFPISTHILENGHFLECVQIILPDECATSTLTKEAIEYAVSNIRNEVSLPYQMLHIARRCLETRDYRGCVLNCASALEIPFNQAIDKYLNSHTIPFELHNWIDSKLYGIEQKAKLCKKLGIPLSYRKKYESVMKERNDVIHGGKNPSYKDAKSLLDLTYEFLREQNIELFE